MNLRLPGPTPLPPEVCAALARPMINHRGPEFAALLAQVTARLQEVFQTQNDVLLLTTSGTGGLESAMVNEFSAGDHVLMAVNGVFGERFAAIAVAYGLAVTRLDFPPGQAADPATIATALRADPAAKALLVTHNETSTGVTNDLAAIAAVVQAARAQGRDDLLLIVDAVSSLGAIDLPTDRWGCDVVVTCAQKAWMTPPGLAMVSVSPRAWQAQAAARLPRFYFDFARAKSAAEKGATPWTPAISLFYALQAALDLMAAEGLPAIFARHRRVGQHTRAAVKALGLSLFADEAHASDTVTAVRVPDGIAVKDLLRRLREEHGVILAGGQGAIADQIFRIGHLGYVSEADIDQAMAALRSVLGEAR